MVWPAFQCTMSPRADDLLRASPEPEKHRKDFWFCGILLACIQSYFCQRGITYITSIANRWPWHWVTLNSRCSVSCIIVFIAQHPLHVQGLRSIVAVIVIPPLIIPGVCGGRSDDTPVNSLSQIYQPINCRIHLNDSVLTNSQSFNVFNPSLYHVTCEVIAVCTEHEEQ